MKHLVAGMVFLILGACGIAAWWADFGRLLRGLVPALSILAGLAAVGAAFQLADEPESEEPDSAEGDDLGP